MRSLGDAVEKDYYLHMVQKISGASLAALEEKMSAELKDAPRLRKTTVAKETPRPPSADLEDAALGIALIEPSTRRWLAALTPDMIETEKGKNLLLFLQHYSENISDDIPKELQNIAEYVKIVLLKSETRYANWEPQEFQTEMARVIKQIITKHREIKKQQLINQLREAEDLGDDSLAESLRRHINTLIKEKM